MLWECAQVSWGNWDGDEALLVVNAQDFMRFRRLGTGDQLRGNVCWNYERFHQQLLMEQGRWDNFGTPAPAEEELRSYLLSQIIHRPISSVTNPLTAIPIGRWVWEERWPLSAHDDVSGVPHLRNFKLPWKSLQTKLSSVDRSCLKRPRKVKLCPDSCSRRHLSHDCSTRCACYWIVIGSEFLDLCPNEMTLRDWRIPSIAPPDPSCWMINRTRDPSVALGQMMARHQGRSGRVKHFWIVGL